MEATLDNLILFEGGKAGRLRCLTGTADDSEAFGCAMLGLGLQGPHRGLRANVELRL